MTEDEAPGRRPPTRSAENEPIETARHTERRLRRPNYLLELFDLPRRPRVR